VKPIPGTAPASLPELIRTQDRMSFLYVERAVINRQDNAITVVDKRGTAHVPATAIASLLLGPGTSITHQAMLLLADSGTTVAWVGENAVRYYAHGRALASSSRLLDRQAELVTDRRQRLSVARAMYQMRFPGEDVSAMTMQQLRGREGVRVQRLYRDHAERTGVRWDNRRFQIGDWDAADPVNQALSAANSCLYGAVHSVICALGCAPGLGFVHTGHELSFVYDIADLYKAAITIPVAFEVTAAVSCGAKLEPAHAARRAVRDAIHDARLLARCVKDIENLLGVTDGVADSDEIFLWDDKEGAVKGGVVYVDPSSNEPTSYRPEEQPWSS
jgi:CRISPR-associated protein Cas1